MSYFVKNKIGCNTNSGFAEPHNIRLGANSLFAKSASLGLEYVKGVDVNRLLAPLYEVHKLTPPDNAKRYGGWERENADNWGKINTKTFTLAGHSLGHWLSGAAAFYAETGDEEILKELNYVLLKLDELQYITGSPYIGGCEEITFTKMFNGDENWHEGFWVPWYGIHKIYQGLIDAYYYANKDTALKVVIKFADWAVDGINNLSEEFMQNTLKVEYGGMNEVFAQLYKITDDKKYLEAARRFTQDDILNPLIKGIDNLTGKHANTQIPKIIGAAWLYESDSVKYADYRKACESFWDMVAQNRSYAMGGNSIAEHFEEEGAETTGIKTCESCNSYNMLKLTEHLFDWTKDSKYMDYYENVLYNHLLGQQDPDTGSKMYFVSTLQGHHRIYEKKYESWWCCCGTGMENPGRYTRCTYYEDSDSLYVNLYMPTEYTWEKKGLAFDVETDYPYSDKVRIKVKKGNAQAILKFRAPSWLASDMTALVNGKKSYKRSSGGYLCIGGEWKEGDVIEITLPMNIWVYKSRNKSQIAYKYGAITLAAQLGYVKGVMGVEEYVSNETILDRVVQKVPHIITNGTSPETLVTKTGELTFKINGENSSFGKDIYLNPFYEIHHCFHNIYWDLDEILK